MPVARRRAIPPLSTPFGISISTRYAAGYKFAAIESLENFGEWNLEELRNCGSVVLVSDSGKFDCDRRPAAIALPARKQSKYS